MRRPPHTTDPHGTTASSPDHDGIKFVVIAYQRTGSSWLMDLLNRQKGCEGFGELFHSQPRLIPEAYSNEYPRFVQWDPGTSAPRRLMTFRYCNGLYARAGTVGFKLMYSQLRTFPELVLYFKLRGIRVIHLVRNELDIVISGAVKAASGVAHIREGDGKVDIRPITMDPAWVVSRIKSIRSKRATIRRLLRSLSFTHVELAYEELVPNPRLATDFLGLEYADSGSSLKKTIRRQKDVVTNLQEVEDAVSALG